MCVGAAIGRAAGGLCLAVNACVFEKGRRRIDSTRVWRGVAVGFFLDRAHGRCKLHATGAMSSYDVYPRRKRAQRGTREPEHHGPAQSDEAPDLPTREALDVAGYISDMTAQLEAMAVAGGLDLLAYFLGMARSEADLYLRTNSGAEEGAEGEDDTLSDEGQVAFDSSGS